MSSSIYDQFVPGVESPVILGDTDNNNEVDENDLFYAQPTKAPLYKHLARPNTSQLSSSFNLDTSVVSTSAITIDINNNNNNHTVVAKEASKEKEPAKEPSVTSSSSSVVAANVPECASQSAHSNKKRGCDDDLVSARVTKKSRHIVTYQEMTKFFQLLDGHKIKEFLRRDKCYLVSDKYALAMVFTYFKRARFELIDYTEMNFFLALYLANDIEEDVDEFKYEIFPWALGREWRCKFQQFLRKRDLLLKLMDYRALVSRKCCEEVMNLMPDHDAWKRTRSADHGGATRLYLIRKVDALNSTSEDYVDTDVLLPRGPNKVPRPCPLCTIYSGHSCANSRHTSSTRD